MKILTFTKEQVGRFYTTLGKSYNIQCRREMIQNKRFSDVINEDNLSALSNYAKHNNATIYIDDLKNDMFNDIAVYVYKRGVDDNKSFVMNLNKTKEEFANCMRTLYKNVEKAVSELKVG